MAHATTSYQLYAVVVRIVVRIKYVQTIIELRIRLEEVGAKAICRQRCRTGSPRQCLSGSCRISDDHSVVCRGKWSAELRFEQGNRTTSAVCSGEQRCEAVCGGVGRILSLFKGIEEGLRAAAWVCC